MLRNIRSLAFVYTVNYRKLQFKADTIKREKLMAFSLIASALITLLTALAWNFPIILALSLLKGIALSGVSAVALAYLNEEVSPAVIGVAISLYLSGNTIGGMSGRVCGALIAGWSNWHFSALFIGLTALIIGIVFAKRFPASLHFHLQHTPFNPNRPLDTPDSFPMGRMRLPGILPASVRILFLATPRRSPLRLRLGGKHAA